MAILYMNGQMIKNEKAMVSVYDHGFLYGLGLFETFRTYNGECFLLERHMKRLKDSCDQLGIDFTMSAEHIQQIVRELLISNSLIDAYVRMTVSAGIGELGLPTSDYKKPTVVIMVKALSTSTEQSWQAGKPLQLLTTKRNSPEGDYRFKSLHYMNNIIAKRELMQLADQRVLGAEGLMLNENGYIAEGIVSNVFYVKQGVIYTPDVNTGILPGITRRFVIELALDAGYEVEEGYYSFNQLLQASEIWITNSIQELVPITALFDTSGNEYTISNGKAGPVCEQIRTDYKLATINKE